MKNQKTELNAENEKSLEQFRNYLELQDKSENTIRAYLYAVRQFLERYSSADHDSLMLYKCYLIDQSPPPVKRVARGAGYKPLLPDRVSRRPDFLSVQVTIALDALLMPLKGRSYYFHSTLKRVFVFLYT